MTCACSSCARRASWSPAQRRAFDLADDERERLEAMERGVPLPDPELVDALRLAVAGRRLPPRRVEDLAGRTFGKLTAIRLEPYERCGVVRREWRCRCACGNELVASASRLRLGEVTACVACSRAARRGAVSRTAEQLGITKNALKLRRLRQRRREVARAVELGRHAA